MIALAGNMLSFTKSIEPTEAYFYAVYADAEGKETWSPIEVTVEGLRGQNADCDSKNPGASNIQLSEFARMPTDSNQLAVTFSLKVMPNSQVPHSAMPAQVSGNYQMLTAEFRKVGLYEDLAVRYLENLANARFMDQNRRRAETGIVTIRCEGVEVSFDSYQFSLIKFSGIEGMKAALVEGNDANDVDALLSKFVEGLTVAPKTIKVMWRGEYLSGLEIKPSQLYPSPSIRKLDPFYGRFKDEDRSSESQNSWEGSRKLAKRQLRKDGKTYYVAAISAGKIGAMLRTIDMGAKDGDVLPANPYAGDQSTQTYYRGNKTGKLGLYDIQRKGAEAVIAGLEDPQLKEDNIFFLANLIRGGVFSDGKAKDPSSAEKAGKGKGRGKGKAAEAEAETEAA